MSESAVQKAPPMVPGSRREALRQHVASRVGRLQATYLNDSSRATAMATLARLRRAVTSEPGSDPTVWEATLGGMPMNLLGRGDSPSPAERAVHGALTLYATHQQSQRAGMHRPTSGLGAAVRQLANGTDSEAAVTRRFQALGTATTLAETLHHARGLITQLRGASIPIDYGALAVDLHDLQDPRRADSVRLVWGREFYRTRVESAPAVETAASSEPDSPEGVDA